MKLSDEPPRVSPEQCPCQRYKTGAELLCEGHVVTTDPGCIKMPDLRQLFLKGRKYRTEQDISGMRPAVEEALEGYIVRFTKDGDNERLRQFEKWKQEIMNAFDYKMVDLKKVGFHEAQFLSGTAKEELRLIRNAMVITFADKSTHDLVLMCKNQYKVMLHRELTSGTVYRPLKVPVEKVFEQHAKMAEFVGQCSVNAAAHLYAVVKLHKSPVGLRWIAGSSRATVTRGKKIPTTSIGQSAAALGGMLREVMHMLLKKDMQLYRRTGVRRYWIVNSAEEVAQQMKQLKAETQGRLWTRDFTSMYTSPTATPVATSDESLQRSF